MKIPNGANKATIVRIINTKENPSDDNIHESEESDNGSDSENDMTYPLKELSPIIAILWQSFLRPQQKQSERTAAKIGHTNETCFLKDFWEQQKEGQLYSPEGLTLPLLHVIYRPGLVCKAGENNCFVKDLADGVAVCEFLFVIGFHTGQVWSHFSFFL